MDIARAFYLFDPLRFSGLWGVQTQPPSSRTVVCDRAVIPPPTAAAKRLLRAHGFAVADMVELVRAGLATATTEHVVVGSRMVEGRVGEKPPVDVGEFRN